MYTEHICRATPSLVLYLPDQSSSTNDPIGGNPQRKKCDGVSDALNTILRDIALRCAKPEGVRNYFDIGILGYGEVVGSVFGGNLAGRDIVPISDVAQNPLEIIEKTRKVEDGAGGLVDEKVKTPIWVRSVAKGGTPMRKAFSLAIETVRNWIPQHQNSFPPIAINISDGESTDGDPTPEADALKSLSTSDGNVLLFNIHISSQQAPSIEFPDNENGLPDEYARLLFRMSSILPEYMRGIAQQQGYQVSEQTRGFTFNADMVALVRFLNTGTPLNNLR